MGLPKQRVKYLMLSFVIFTVKYSQFEDQPATKAG
jgi:hypothetical protein